MTDALRSSPGFVCPRCRAPVTLERDQYRCHGCASLYPVVAGIPDFRVTPDPWIGLDEDRAKSERLSRLIGSVSFDDAVRAYWSITPETPRALAEHFVGAVLRSADEAREWMASLDPAPPSGGGAPWLDVGCGTGALVAAGAERGVGIVGVDIALRWLVVARRRPGLAASALVCANGEHLPFAEASFARVVSVGTIEHCVDAAGVLRDARRVMQQGGVLHVKTTSRYTMLPEPHVQLWGVGLLPRRWADRYVRWRTGQRYMHHRPLSPRELARDMRRAGFRDVSVAASPMLAAQDAALGRAMRALLPIYEWTRRSPIVRRGVRWIAPLIDARGVAA
ncbi:MAG: class I SAM-dependent methyltransferase [Gemmatimonadaceae bacterium]